MTTSKCLFHAPDSQAATPAQRQDNWLAIERWANVTLRESCICPCAEDIVDWAEDCYLHIPHPLTDDPDEEEQNWLELERWTNRLRNCGCQAEEEPGPPT